MFNFISIGYDCSPAAALRVLNYRNFALPFDWIITNIINSIIPIRFIQILNVSLWIDNNDSKKIIKVFGFRYPSLMCIFVIYHNGN
jgi:hypothetical protein